ncbi:MAG: helix-turn-helix domain-containing protein [Candidatus Schekmanbacteria bacterium]|nr:helix-turn-helix domain-containing protein [Candidatus Schekmanbacteria bacterium]
MTEIKNEYYPDYVTPPGETLQELLETLGMSKKELALRIGKTEKTIGEIIKHNAPITPGTAMELEKVFGVPASFWNSRECRYRENIARQEEESTLLKNINWLEAMPVREMIRKGWVRDLKDNSLEQLKELLSFFAVSNPAQWEEYWLSPKAVYRISTSTNTDPKPCAAWIRQGELIANKIKCESYTSAKFLENLKIIRKLTKKEPATFQKEATKLCAAAGVAVIFLPPLKKMSVYGVTRWLTPDKAMLLLSLRGSYEDILWFTFFHEAGHILKHGKREVFIEDKDDCNQLEEEANSFARDFLIPPKDYRNLMSKQIKDSQFIKSFAEELSISPAIIVGRLMHEKLLPWGSRLSNIRRRFSFKNNV